MIVAEQVQFSRVPTVFAVSGGVDSMVLLDIARKHLPREYIIVAHLHHMLRGNASDRDEAFVRAYCREHVLTYASERQDIAALARKEKSSIEAAARRYRYQFLARVYQDYHAECLITAHHLDDRIETAVFHLIRGTK